MFVAAQIAWQNPQKISPINRICQIVRYVFLVPQYICGKRSINQPNKNDASSGTQSARSHHSHRLFDVDACPSRPARHGQQVNQIRANTQGWRYFPRLPKLPGDGSHSFGEL